MYRRGGNARTSHEMGFYIAKKVISFAARCIIVFFGLIGFQVHVSLL